MKLSGNLAAAAIGVGLLAGCDAPALPSAPSGSDPAWLAVVDRTLVNGDIQVTLQSDGRVSGSGIEGVWEERDGKYCRTLVKPERFAGAECQVVMLNGDQVTFDNQKGRVSTWTVQ